MNVKGLKFNKKLIHLLYDSIDSINVNNLHGIDAFNAFSWKGFKKEELKNLINLFVYLDNNDFFKNFDDDKTYIFNYSTDVTEIDIVTIAEKDNNPILIDIELKNGDEEDLIPKMQEQLRKRKNTHLPQLIKKNSYFVIGFVNEKYVYGYYYNGVKISEIEDFEKAKLVINGFSEYKNVEDYLMQTSNLASIAKICDDIKNGRYNFYEDTNKLYLKLIDKIGKEDAFIIYGHAGTGKSVLALRLFFENENTKILIVNSKLYNALNFNHKYYFERRATFNTNYFLDFIDNDTISIVDECQRIPIEVMVKIIKKSKMTYLFGDNRQAFYNNSTLLKAKELEKELKNTYGFKVSSKEITKTRRYSDVVDKALSFLTIKDPKPKDIKLPNDYQIKLFYDEKKFLEYYKSLDGIKKIYVPVNQANVDEIGIDGIIFKKANYRDDSFSIWADSLNYYGTTYHALSFDIDHCFIFLNNIHMINLGKKQVMFYRDSYDKDHIDEIDLFLNELNVLFTRGKKSLNIYVDDIEAYLYLNSLLLKLK